MNPIDKTLIDLAKNDPINYFNAARTLVEQMAIRNCKFDQVIVPVLLRPIFIHSTISNKAKLALKHVISILEKVTKLYFTHPELSEFFNLSPAGKKLVELEHGYPNSIIIARPDAFFTNTTFKFVEFNCDSPAGPAYADVVENIFKESFPLQALEKEYTLLSNNRSLKLLNALLKTYKNFGGTKPHPSIAIVDWKNVKTRNEFEILQKLFKALGYPTIIADPRELKLTNNQLEHKGFKIDIIYRRVIFREMLTKLKDMPDFITAYKKGVVCVANPFRSRLVSNKSILAMITNTNDYGYLFSDDEKEIIKKHIPWTRLVKDDITNKQGEIIELKKHIKTKKDNLVLKPADSYGGKNVMIGHECEQATWDNLLHHILNNGEKWVIQDYVKISSTKVPVPNSNKMLIKSKKYNINPFVFNGHYAGSMARFSDQSVINVTAGGGMVPVIEYNGGI